MEKNSIHDAIMFIDLIRERMGITKLDFCREIHVSPATYRKWLSGNTRSYTCSHLSNIARVLEIPQTEKWLHAIID